MSSNMNRIRYSQEKYIEQRRRKQRHDSYKSAAVLLVLVYIAAELGMWIGRLLVGAFA